MRSGRELRRVVMGRIIDQVPALDGRVYDSATETTPFPYVTMGPSYWTDASVECIRAKSITLQIDVWDQRTNKGALEDLTDAIADALDGFSETVDMTTHPIQVTLVRVMDDIDDAIVHGVIQIGVLAEAG